MLNASEAGEGMSPHPDDLRRLGRNINGYFGETINIAEVLEGAVGAARSTGWQVEETPIEGGLNLVFCRRETSGDRTRGLPQSGKGAEEGSPGGTRRVYISSGIHGDEPAGPLAMRQLLAENAWPAGIDLWVCPCLNPGGFRMNRRENPQGLDLNRQYLAPKAPETVAHIQWLGTQPAFCLSLCIHEDWESSGFYVYELNPDGRESLAERIVERVSRVCPIDRSELIEGRPAHEGIIRPNLDPRSRPDWPEAFYLITHKSRRSYTLEAPSDFPLRIRVAALVEGVRGALEGLVAAPPGLPKTG